MASGEVSGRYRGRGRGFEVALRVDVDGPTATNCVSADYYHVSGRERRHARSMRVDAPAVKVTRGRVTITGTGVFSSPTKCKQVQVTIPRVAVGSPPAPATLRHVTAPGVIGTVYECGFEAPSFRVVELEEAREEGVQPVESYDTTALPSPGPPRTLTTVEAFAEAGIEMRSVGAPTVIRTSEAGANLTWSDSELQAAMEEHFSRWGDRPDWAIWLFHAASHDDERLAGVMFDQRGRQRQGCAVFYGYESDDSPPARRDHLRTCVHELGHGFNLLHSWQQSLREPPLPSRPDARSWMNYPQRYPGGPDAFWPDFGFCFDRPELVHLRHGFEADVIMGGRPFAGGPRRAHGARSDAQERDDPGLRLKLTAPAALVQEVPVTVGLELSATTRYERPTAPVLGPRPQTIDIAIQAPDGREFVFEPLLTHCRGDEMVALRAGAAPVRDYAFIHYGRKGYTFDRPGRYLVRARYSAPEGVTVLSNVAAIRVMAPVTRADRHVARMIGGDEQVGTLMALMGSGARALQRGNDRLAEISRCYPTHPVGAVARLVSAANLARGFKTVDVRGAVSVSPPRVTEAAALVADIIDVPRMLAAAAAPSAGGPVQDLGTAGAQIPVRAGVDPTVSGFLNSRPPDAARLQNAAAELVVQSAAPGSRWPGPNAGRNQVSQNNLRDPVREASRAPVEPSTGESPAQTSPLGPPPAQAS